MNTETVVEIEMETSAIGTGIRAPDAVHRLSGGVAKKKIRDTICRDEETGKKADVGVTAADRRREAGFHLQLALYTGVEYTL